MTCFVPNELATIRIRLVYYSKAEMAGDVQMTLLDYACFSMPR